MAGDDYYPQHAPNSLPPPQHHGPHQQGNNGRDYYDRHYPPNRDNYPPNRDNYPPYEDDFHNLRQRYDEDY